MPDLFVSEDPKNDTQEPVRYERGVSDVVSPQIPQQQTQPSAPEEQPPAQSPEQNTVPIPEGTLVIDDSPLPNHPLVEEEEAPQSYNQNEQSPIDQTGTRTNYHLIQETHTTGIPLLTSFWQNPQGVYFETQGAHEPILLFLRKHFITNVPWVSSVIFFLIVPLFLGYLTQISNLNLDIFHAFSASDIRILLAFYMLLVLTYAFIKFIGWYYNIVLVTPERILDIELEDLVSKKIAETKITRVQDVQNVQTGTIRSLLDYGDVLIQTAAAQDDFFIRSVPRPELVLKVVGGLIGKEQNSGGV